METNEKSTAFRTILKIVIGLGVGKVVDDIITALLPAQVSVPVKIVHKIGAYGISWVVGDWVADKIEEEVDGVREYVKQLSQKIIEAREAIEKEEAIKDGE